MSAPTAELVVIVAPDHVRAHRYARTLGINPRKALIVTNGITGWLRLQGIRPDTLHVAAGELDFEIWHEVQRIAATHPDVQVVYG